MYRYLTNRFREFFSSFVLEIPCPANHDEVNKFYQSQQAATQQQTQKAAKIT
jgi:phage FluMu protein Com